MALTHTAILDNGRAVADSICYAPSHDAPLDANISADANPPTPVRADWRMGSTAGIVAFVSRFLLLQTVGAAMIAALWIAGLASLPFEGENGPICWLIVAIGAIGILLVFLQRWRDVQWVATHVVRIGLLGTVVGLIIAFSAARQGGSADVEQVKTMITAVVDGMYVSLFATLLGIAVNLWLKINLRLLGDHHG